VTSPNLFSLALIGTFKQARDTQLKVKMLSKILSTFPTLATQRLTLRQPLESDVQEIFLLRSNTTVNKYLDREPTETVEEALSFIRKVNDNFKNNAGVYWAITTTDNEKLVGTICLFNFSDQDKKCEIGYELLPNYQGQGIMNEALEKIIAFTFHTLGFETIDAFTHKDNQSSTKLLQKFNFRETSIIDEANANLIAFHLTNSRMKN
jgi:[ribosomal protein S5]-alanine N-acetyltransferase